MKFKSIAYNIVIIALTVIYLLCIYGITIKYITLMPADFGWHQITIFGIAWLLSFIGMAILYRIITTCVGLLFNK